MNTSYDVKGSLQSLLGYGKSVHNRSGGVCQYCGYGVKMETDTETNFDLWRQLTVEHLISEAGGGYLYQQKYRIAFEQLVHRKFPILSDRDVQIFVEAIDRANTKTACRCCNSMTSRDHELKIKKTFADLLNEYSGSSEEVREHMSAFLDENFKRRREVVRNKLNEAKKVFQKDIEPVFKSLLSSNNDNDE